MKLRALLLVLFCVSLPMTGSAADSQTDADAAWPHLNRNLNGRDTWSLNGLQNYRFHLRQRCNCPRPVDVDIDVKEGRVFRITDRISGRVHGDTDTLRGYRSIDGYFQLIDELWLRQPDRVELRHDRYLGYPSRILIDPSLWMADDEVDIDIDQLVPLPASD